MDQNQALPGSLASRLANEVQPVYRYHLARSENYLETQNRTALTFQTALEWIDTYPLKENSFRPWLLGIARYQQSFGRHPAYARNAQPAVSPRQESEEILLSSAPVPAQEEILQREQISRLSAAWKRLPRIKADALALHYFGGLTLAEVGIVLGKDIAEVEAMVSQEGRLKTELLNLAADVHPSKEFTAELTLQIMKARAWTARQPGLGSRLVNWIEADVWKMAFRVRSIFAAGSRVIEAVLLVGILAAGFYVIQRQSTIAPQAQSTATPTVSPTIAVEVASLPLMPEAMAPPDSGACQAWKKTLENQVYASFSMKDSTAFSDPTDTNPAISGTGCELDATIIGNIQDNAWKTVSDIGMMFFNSGFSLGNGFDNLPDNPATTFFDQNCPGFGRSYQKDDLYVFLAASYCPALSTEALSTPGGAPQQYASRGYSLRLILASSSVQTRLNQFFSRWASGNKQAISDLSPALRSKFPDVRSLDRMAGLSRSPSNTISFIWQPVQNSGTNLRVEVVVKETDSQKGGQGPQPPFQIVLTQNNDLWQISDATHTILSSSTTDSAILADDQGQVFRLSLADGLATPLSEPGIYLPGASRTSRFPAQVSPDGSWLALLQPGSGAQAGTWLLSLTGQPAIHLNSQELNLAWSPDSQKIAYFDPLDSQLLVITLSTGKTDILAQMNGIPVSLAWSPTGEMIGIATLESKLIFNASGTAATTNYVTIGLVPLSTGKIQVLAQAVSTVTTLSPNDLFWTADSQELWYGPGEAAFNVHDGSVHPLIAQPLAGELSNQQAELLTFPQPGRLFTNFPEAVLSPDGQNMAEVYSTTNSTNDYLAILPVSVTGSSGQNQCCLEYLSGIAAFAWTGDGKNLVVYTGTNGPGNLLLVNPSSGNRQTAATQVYYIGMLSSMKQAGLKQAPTVKVSRVPPSDVSQSWSRVDNSTSGISLEIPTGWRVWQPDKDYTWGPLVVANLNFEDPFGFSSLNQNDLYISISKVPIADGQTAAGWYSQIETINQEGQVYTPVTIDGIRGFRRVMNGDLAPKDEIMLPFGESIVVIDKYPLVSNDDLVYKQILATLNFR